MLRVAEALDESDVAVEARWIGAQHTEDEQREELISACWTALLGRLVEDR